jgi:hypothetical protein
MKRLILESWLLLFYIDCVMKLRTFKHLYGLVRHRAVSPKPFSRAVSSEEICRAVDMACVFYFKRILCLQRSSATTILLRRWGWNAEMVIGAQPIPFKSHAWCEIEGRVVNDKPYVRDMYQAFDHC